MQAALRLWVRVRENLETLVVALLAALFIRQYLVEPYKIPTGSMAPGLRGVHRDVACPGCGMVFETGCDDPVAGSVGDASYEAACPNCASRARLGSQPVRRGDKILANKLLFLLRPPKRWEVVVFLHSDSSGRQKTYIKRLAGLPGDKLEIRHGDLYVNDAIARRDPDVLEAMRVPVYDSAWPDPEPRRERWRTGPSVFPERGTFRFDSAGWEELAFLPEIRDWLPYNSVSRVGESRLSPVGDLRVEAVCEVPSGGGIGCEIREDDDVFTWTLGSGGEGFEARVRSTPTRREPLPSLSPGRHVLVFTNVDDRQSLEVDGRPAGAWEVQGSDEGTPASGVRLLGRGGVRILSVRIDRDSGYSQEGAACRNRPLVVPPGRYFFLGDNSLISEDSRKWASWSGDDLPMKSTIPEGDVLGKAFLLVKHLDVPWDVPYTELRVGWIR